MSAGAATVARRAMRKSVSIELALDRCERKGKERKDSLHVCAFVLLRLHENLLLAK